MNINCVNIGREEESLNIKNISFLIRFNETREMLAEFLSIFLTTAASSASVERVNSKERVPKVPVLIPASSYAQR